MHGVSLRKHGIVYGLAALVSLLLSYWASIRGAVINPDAICYLQSAQTLKDGLQAATQLCGQAKWPFYSALIYSVTYVTHLSYLHSAYILDAIFSCVSVLTFVAIVETLFSTPTKRILWLAAIVVLLGHEFNAVREYIIRDHGFWCFYLLSILFLLNYFRTKQWCYALAWNMSVILATLFRIEGIIFLALLPLASFIGHRSNGWRSFFKLNALTSLILIFGIFIVVLYPQHFSHYLTRINEVQFQLLHGVSEIAHRFQESAKILSQQVLSQYSAHESMLILSLVLLA